MQRVFGFSHRLPNSLLSDDIIDPLYLSQDPLEDFHRAEQLRQAATRAWAALDNRTRMLKVLRARHRTPQSFTEGQLVFVWRQPRVGSGRWHGPGVIVLPTAGGAWINMRGSLWRVANEQMRGAINEESLGAEIVNRYLGDMRQNLRNFRGLRRYVDVEREGPPRFPGDPDIAAGEEVDEDLPRLTDSEPEEEQVGRHPIAHPRPAMDASAEPPQSRPRLESNSAASEPMRELASSVSEPLYSPTSPAPEGAPVSFNVYMEQESSNPSTFIVGEAEAYFSEESDAFFIPKKRPGDEISVQKLDGNAQKLFLDKGGSREKEWNAIKIVSPEGVAAIRVHRGRAARELRIKYADRIVPSRWHDKWKDMGDDFDNKLKNPEIPKHLGATSR